MWALVVRTQAETLKLDCTFSKLPLLQGPRAAPLTRRQDQLHNLQAPLQNKNARPLVKNFKTAIAEQ